jgi:hypothetical protein
VPRRHRIDRARVPLDSNLISGDTVRGSPGSKGHKDVGSESRWPRTRSTSRCSRVLGSVARSSGLAGATRREHSAELKMHEDVTSRCHHVDSVRVPPDSELISGDTVRGSPGGKVHRCHRSDRVRVPLDSDLISGDTVRGSPRSKAYKDVGSKFQCDRIDKANASGDRIEPRDSLELKVHRKGKGNSFRAPTRVKSLSTRRVIPKARNGGSAAHHSRDCIAATHVEPQHEAAATSQRRLWQHGHPLSSREGDTWPLHCSDNSSATVATVATLL